MSIRVSYGIASLALCALAVGCLPAGDSGAGFPAKFRVGVVPDESKDILRDRYAGLINYLSEELQVPCRLVIADSYDHLLELFHEREVDFAFFGGVTFVQAHDRDEAVPLVIRDIDAEFSSYYLIRQDSGIETFADLEGKSFSFGSKLSTSGHYMPRVFMQQEGIVPEEFFGAIIYSGAHDATALAVQNGEVDAGVASGLIVEEMIEDGRLDDSVIEVIWETRPYANYVWAIQSRFGESVEEQVCDAFLNLLPNDEGHAAILDALGAEYFVPAIVEEYTSSEEYNTIRELMAAEERQGGGTP